LEVGETGYDNVNWFVWLRIKDQWHALVNMVMNLQDA
jgi:hypothetical protein